MIERRQFVLRRLHSLSGVFPVGVFLDSAMLWLVAWVLFRGPAALVDRLRAMRRIMEEAEQGK